MGQAVRLASNFVVPDDSFKAENVTLSAGKVNTGVPVRGVLS